MKTLKQRCDVVVSTILYTVACSQPISFVGEHCSGAPSVDAVLAVSRQLSRQQ